jgi:hypothetical protein
MKDFIKENHHMLDVKKLKSYYNIYKTQWKEKMVEFLLKQLEISEENVEDAKKNRITISSIMIYTNYF